MRQPIYLDYQATTPLDPRVLEAMLPYFGSKFGNAASRTHCYGWEAEKAVEIARKRLAEVCGVTPREIIFTSGATESINLALKGAADAYRSQGRHMVALATEHRAVLDTLRRLESQGVLVTLLTPRPDGLADLDQLRDALRPDTILVSVMHAHNEIGVIQPLEAVGAVCREKGVLFHCDAAQAFGKIPVDPAAAGIAMMPLSAHKIYGPKGVGALVVRRGVRLTPQIDGGGHEAGLRSGTLNVPGIVGFGRACEIAAAEGPAEAAHVGGLRDRFRARIEGGLDGVGVNGSMEHRLPGNLNLSFAGVNAEALLMNLPDVALSTGSACSSATAAASHVLLALGLPESVARSSVRFGLGRFTTEQEVDEAAARVIEVVSRLRQHAPAGQAAVL